MYVCVFKSNICFSVGRSMAEHAGRIVQSAPCNTQILLSAATELSEG